MRGRRGQYVMALVIALSVLLAVAAVTVDLGNAVLLRTQMQGAADAIAHASALVLDGTSEGITRSAAVADELAGANSAGGHAITLGESAEGAGEIAASQTPGIWDFDARTFTASTDPDLVNAVHVEVGLANAGSWFARAAFGRESTPLRIDTVAALWPGEGAGRVSCFIPLAIAECLLTDVYGTDGIEAIDLVLNPPGVDNTGWVRPDGNPNAAWLRNQIRDCTYDGSVSIGDTVKINNGLMTTVFKTLAQEIDDSDTAWDDSVWGSQPAQLCGSEVDEYGHTYEGPVMIFDDPTYCEPGGGSWMGSQTVSGFAWGAVYDVKAHGAAASNTIRMRIDTTRDYAIGTSGGGPDYGVIGPGEIVIVR